MKYKIRIEESLLEQSIKLDNIKQEIKIHFNKYDKFLKKHMLPDGIVGENCQFKTYQEMMRFILDNISDFKSFKEKINIDSKNYKLKLESMMQSFQNKIDNTTRVMTQFTNKNIKQCEERIKGLINIYDTKLVNLRVENNDDFKKLNTETEKLKEELEKISEIKKEINDKINIDITNTNNFLKENLEEFRKELDEVTLGQKKLNEIVNKINNLKNYFLY